MIFSIFIRTWNTRGTSHQECRLVVKGLLKSPVLPAISQEKPKARRPPSLGQTRNQGPWVLSHTEVCLGSLTKVNIAIKGGNNSISLNQYMFPPVFGFSSIYSKIKIKSKPITKNTPRNDFYEGEGTAGLDL